MVTVGAVMNQATPTPVWICSGVTPVARRVHQTLSISVSLLPHLLITPIHVDLVSIPWTSVVHSQLCLCITLSYSFLQRCSFLYLGPASPLLFQEVFPEHLTCIFHVFSFVVSLFSCAIYCLLIVTQGPSKRRHIQIGQFERNLIKGPFIISLILLPQGQSQSSFQRNKSGRPFYSDQWMLLVFKLHI